MTGPEAVGVGLGFLAIVAPEFWPKMPRALSYTLAGIGLSWLTYSFILGVEELSHAKLTYGPLAAIIAGAILIALGLFWHIHRLGSEIKGEKPGVGASSHDGTDKNRTKDISDELKQLSPIIEALKSSQMALAESEQTKNLLGRVTSQFDQLESGIAAQKQFSGKKRIEDRLAAAEHVIKELRTILGNVHSQKTPQGDILLIKTAPNTFRVTFAVPMRIAPHIEFTELPDGAVPHLVEHSALGFTVVFAPATLSVEHFGFTASAEL